MVKWVQHFTISFEALTADRSNLLMFIGLKFIGVNKFFLYLFQHEYMNSMKSQI